MRTYVRTRVAGGICFFTVNLAERQGNTLLTNHIDALRDAFRRTRSDHPFAMPAFVVLPEHLHCLWILPADDSDFSMRWRLIKSRFSRNLPAGEHLSGSRVRRRERGIWQRRYWEHLIRDEADFQRHLDFIHYNSVKHGHVGCAWDWPHSSFRHWVERGTYSADWRSSAISGRIEPGEALG